MYMSASMHSDAYNIFRALLLERRRSKNLTQVDLAELLGKPQSFISKYERGERRLDFVEFLKIAEALGIDILEFIKEFKARQ